MQIHEVPEENKDIPADVGCPQERLQLFVFRIGQAMFAMHVTRVNEILDEVPFTSVPRSDSFAPGIINVRGKVVPLVDLGVKFNIECCSEGSSLRTIVFDVCLDGAQTKVALRANEVYEVTEIDSEQCENLPELSVDWDRRYVQGIFRRSGSAVTLLNLEEVFS